ncbi:hypothetical protein ACI3K4_27875 [Streptomyces sp. CSMPJR101]|uniref:hypothetical protein n=1 Tax=Streptomyces sp. CSMPJR101 TaxID=1279378 RepID=UPI00385525DD
MSDRLTPEREAEIRGWVAVMGVRKDIRYYGSHHNMTDLLAELDALRADNAHLQHMVAGLKAQQDRDDAEYAQAIKERDRALEALEFQERNTLPELRRQVEHHKDGKQRWRERAEKAEARVAELEAERHTTNEALDDAVQELRRRDLPEMGGAR